MIDFTQRRPALNAGARSAQNNGDRPAAKVWLNVGFYAGEGENQKFVSLPQGIPLDTMEPIRVNSSNEDFRMFQSARNDLLEALLAEAANLAPGEENVVNIQVQIRRVSDEQAAPAAGENLYSQGLSSHKLVG